MGANQRGRHIWRLYIFVLFVLILTACAPTAAAPQVRRVALLAPFEGRYREIGYDAIYPIRLALKDSVSDVVLITADDGGTPESAAIQARRLAADPTILAALVIGPIATNSAVLEAFGDVPVMTIGLWNAAPAEDVFVLASEDLASVRTTNTSILNVALDTDSSAIGGELFALKQYAKLRPTLTGLSVALSAVPAESDFSARLIASDLFVPAAGALSTIAYDAGGLIHTVGTSATTRAEVLELLKTLEYTGINGRIAFTDEGWWDDAPVVLYHYQSGVLTPSPAP